MFPPKSIFISIIFYIILSFIFDLSVRFIISDCFKHTDPFIGVELRRPPPYFSANSLHSAAFVFCVLAVPSSELPPESYWTVAGDSPLNLRASAT